MIHCRFSLKKVSVDGVSIIVNSDEVADIKKKYPNAKVKGLRRKSNKKKLHGDVHSIPVSQYLKQQGA